MSASRVVGWSQDGYQVYEAIAEQECSRCERTIAAGERFTRRMMRGGGRRRWATCRDCANANVPATETGRESGA